MRRCDKAAWFIRFAFIVPLVVGGGGGGGGGAAANFVIIRYIMKAI